jgi:hypothetical protein
MNFWFRRPFQDMGNWGNGAEAVVVGDNDLPATEALAIDRLFNSLQHAARLEDRRSALLSLRSVLASSGSPKSADQGRRRASLSAYIGRALFAWFSEHCSENQDEQDGLAYVIGCDADFARALKDVLMLACFPAPFLYSPLPHHGHHSHHDHHSHHNHQVEEDAHRDDVEREASVYAELLIRRHPRSILAPLCVYAFALELLSTLASLGQYTLRLLADFVASDTSVASVLLALIDDESASFLEAEVVQSQAVDLWRLLFSVSKPLQERALFESILERCLRQRTPEFLSQDIVGRQMLSMLAMMVQGNYGCQRQCLANLPALKKILDASSAPPPEAIELLSELSDHPLPDLMPAVLRACIATVRGSAECLCRFLGMHGACGEAVNDCTRRNPQLLDDLLKVCTRELTDVWQSWLHDNREMQLQVLTTHPWREGLQQALSTPSLHSQASFLLHLLRSVIKDNEDAGNLLWRQMTSTTSSPKMAQPDSEKSYSPKVEVPLSDVLMLYIYGQTPQSLDQLVLLSSSKLATNSSVDLPTTVLFFLRALLGSPSEGVHRDAFQWLTLREESFVPHLLEWLVCLDVRWHRPLSSQALMVLLSLLKISRAVHAPIAVNLMNQMSFLKQRLGVHHLLRLVDRDDSDRSSKDRDQSAHLARDYERLIHEAPPKTSSPSPQSSERLDVELEAQVVRLRRDNAAMLAAIEQLQRENELLLLGSADVQAGAGPPGTEVDVTNDDSSTPHAYDYAHYYGSQNVPYPAVSTQPTSIVNGPKGEVRKERTLSSSSKVVTI